MRLFDIIRGRQKVSAQYRRDVLRAVLPAVLPVPQAALLDVQVPVVHALAVARQGAPALVVLLALLDVVHPV